MHSVEWQGALHVSHTVADDPASTMHLSHPHMLHHTLQW